MSEDKENNTILFSTFYVSNKRCRVYFRRNVLIWEMEHLPYARQTVPVADIISVNYGTGSSEDKVSSGTNGFIDPVYQSGAERCSKSLVIHYAQPAANNKWSMCKLVLDHTDSRQMASWYVAIGNVIKKHNRPKSFMVFVNPYCGKGKGISTYKRWVKPVLDVAKVDANVIVTEHGNHARDVILSADLVKYDGILAVGGDGTLSDVINALILRTIRDSNGNENDLELKIPKVSTPVAVIPAGSTDCIAYCLNGTRDKRTAAIFAVLGTLKGLDVCSVHSDKGLCRYTLSVLAYGFLGDVLKESEKHRWMGPRRYEYAGLLRILKNRRYCCEISMTLTTRTTGFKAKCFRYCGICEEEGNCNPRPRYQEANLETIKKDLISHGSSDPEPKKLTVRGRFFLISCANISCACKRSPNGIAPFAHLGDGCMDVLLFKPRSMTDVIKLLVRSGSKKENIFVPDLPFVECYKATEINFRILDEKRETATGGKSCRASVWNCDGEVVSEPNVHIKNYRQLVRMFSRRPQQACTESSPSCFSSCRTCSNAVV